MSRTAVTNYFTPALIGGSGGGGQAASSPWIEALSPFLNPESVGRQILIRGQLEESEARRDDTRERMRGRRIENDALESVANDPNAVDANGNFSHAGRILASGRGSGAAQMANASPGRLQQRLQNATERTRIATEGAIQRERIRQNVWEPRIAPDGTPIVVNRTTGEVRAHNQRFPVLREGESAPGRPGVPGLVSPSPAMVDRQQQGFLLQSAPIVPQDLGGAGGNPMLPNIPVAPASPRALLLPGSLQQGAAPTGVHGPAGYHDLSAQRGQAPGEDVENTVQDVVDEGDNSGNDETDLVRNNEDVLEELQTAAAYQQPVVLDEAESRAARVSESRQAPVRTVQSGGGQPEPFSLVSMRESLDRPGDVVAQAVATEPVSPGPIASASVPAAPAPAPAPAAAAPRHIQVPLLPRSWSDGAGNTVINVGPPVPMLTAPGVRQNAYELQVLQGRTPNLEQAAAAAAMAGDTRLAAELAALARSTTASGNNPDRLSVFIQALNEAVANGDITPQQARQELLRATSFNAPNTGARAQTPGQQIRDLRAVDDEIFARLLPPQAQTPVMSNGRPLLHNGQPVMQQDPAAVTAVNQLLPRIRDRVFEMTSQGIPVSNAIDRAIAEVGSVLATPRMRSGWFGSYQDGYNFSITPGTATVRPPQEPTAANSFSQVVQDAAAPSALDRQIIHEREQMSGAASSQRRAAAQSPRLIDPATLPASSPYLGLTTIRDPRLPSPARASNEFLAGLTEEQRTQYVRTLTPNELAILRFRLEQMQKETR